MTSSCGGGREKNTSRGIKVTVFQMLLNSLAAEIKHCMNACRHTLLSYRPVYYSQYLHICEMFLIITSFRLYNTPEARLTRDMEDKTWVQVKFLIFNEIHTHNSDINSNTKDRIRKTCLVGLLIRSILRGKNCTRASARVQFFQRKIERINRPTRHVLL